MQVSRSRLIFLLIKKHTKVIMSRAEMLPVVEKGDLHQLKQKLLQMTKSRD